MNGKLGREKGIVSTLRERAQRHRFAYLMTSLILIALLSPYLQRTPIGIVIVTLMIAFVLLSGVDAVSDRKRDIVIASILGLLWIIGIFINFILYKINAALFEEYLPSGILFFGFVTVRILSHILRTREITSETLYAAVCVYFLMGITWATAFLLIEKFIPGSFHISHDRNLDKAMTGSDTIYYSFVTLVTLGYGDITPATNEAKSLAVLEAIAGQLYLTILVARLVSLYSSKFSKGEDK
ncbi:MAG: potassium channel family protein [Ignavibacteriales bacterium]